MTAASTVPQKHGFLVPNVIAQISFGLLAMTICLPSMQEWPALFDASQAAVQLTFSGFILAYGCLQLLYGPLSDRKGRKPVLMAGLAISFLASMLAALAPSLEVLTAARVLQGAGSAAGMVVGRALVQDLFEGRERTRTMALVGMTMGLCPPLATIIGGQLHVRIGWQANFVVMAVFAAVLFVAAWRGLPARLPSGSGPAADWRGMLAGYGRLLRVPAFLGFVVLLSCTTAAFYTFLGGAPLVLQGYGVTPDRIGWTIMAVPGAYIIGNALTSRLVRRMREPAIMAIGQVASFGGLLLLLALALAGLHTPLLLALPLVLLGIGHGLLQPPTLSGTVGVVAGLAGSAAAVAGLLQQLAGAVGGFLVGVVPHQGPTNLALLMLAWTIAGLAAHVLLMRVVLPRRATA